MRLAWLNTPQRFRAALAGFSPEVLGSRANIHEGSTGHPGPGRTFLLPTSRFHCPSGYTEVDGAHSKTPTLGGGQVACAFRCWLAWNGQKVYPIYSCLDLFMYISWFKAYEHLTGKVPHVHTRENRKMQSSRPKICDVVTLENSDSAAGVPPLSCLWFGWICCCGSVPGSQNVQLIAMSLWIFAPYLGPGEHKKPGRWWTELKALEPAIASSSLCSKISDQKGMERTEGCVTAVASSWWSYSLATRFRLCQSHRGCL